MVEQRIQILENSINALNLTVRDMAAETVQIRAAAAQAQQALASLTQRSDDAWVAQQSKIDDLEQELADMKSQMRRGGGRDYQKWNLDHKGTVKEYNGDIKMYKGWAKKFMAFCNGKQPVFRKALLWASQQQTPITDSDLQGTNWSHIGDANQKLYDLLITVTTDKALQKVEATVGEDPGFECWRRLARQYDPSSRFTKIDRLNAITQTTESASMRDLLGKIEAWEQKWTKYEVDNSETLSQDLKLGALMKMLQVKEREVVRLKYVENEASLTYEVLRRQVEYWLESVTNGPAPMDLSSLQDNVSAGTLSVEQLEEALDILRRGGKTAGKGGNRQGTERERGSPGSGSRTPKGGGRGSEKGAAAGNATRKIKGNCWNYGKPGHSAADCRGPKRSDLKALDDEQRQLDEEDEGSDTSAGMGMLGLGSLSWAFAPNELGVDDEEDVFFDCLEASLPDNDNYSDGDIDDPNELDLMPFSNIDSESGSEDDDEDGEEQIDDTSDLVRAMEEQIRSKKAKAVHSENESASEGWLKTDPLQESKHDPWLKPKKTVRGAEKIRGIPLTDKYLSLNPFRNLVSSSAYLRHAQYPAPLYLLLSIRTIPPNSRRLRRRASSSGWTTASRRLQDWSQRGSSPSASAAWRRSRSPSSAGLSRTRCTRRRRRLSRAAARS